MNDMYNCRDPAMTDFDDYNYHRDQEYGRNERDWHREKRRRSRSPIDHGEDSRGERSRSRLSDRSDRYDNNSPFRGERDDHRRRDPEDRLMPTTTIEYHHGLPDIKPRQPEPPRESRNRRWMGEPFQTIFLGGLPKLVDERHICAALDESGAVYSDVRTVQDKGTGASRGFAFVEFPSIDDARRWMELNQGMMELRDAHGMPHTVVMDYSKASSSSTRQSSSVPPAARLPAPQTRLSRPPEVTKRRADDWICAKCSCVNFSRRENCFQCYVPRREADRSNRRDEDGNDQIGSNPCNTLLLRGLDALTTEPSIRHSLATVSQVPFQRICIVRNPLTGLSRGYAVVEFASIRDSSMLLDEIQHSGSTFEIDGKAILVSFAKNTYSTLMTYMGQNPSGAQHSVSYEQHGNGNSAMQSSRLGQTRRVSDSTNAAEVAEAALLASRLQAQESNELANVDSSQSATQAVSTPDVNTFVFDDSSGYYYDANTGYYYDANTQYFYNPQTCQFLYWDASAQGYLPAPTSTEQESGSTASSGSVVAADGPASTATEQPVDKIKVERAKQAKKIVKDMERWAKVQNSSKDSSSGGFKKPVAPILSSTTTKKESATADAGFAAISKPDKSDPSKTLNNDDSDDDDELETCELKLVTKSDKFTIELATRSRPFGKTSEDSKAKAAAQLVASYGGDSESDDEVEEPSPMPPPLPPTTSGRTSEDLNLSALEAKMTDFDKLTCLLCKRLFNTKEILLRHQQLSDLHKSNLEQLKKSMTASKGR